MATIEKEKAIDVVKQMVADGQVSQEVAEKYFPELKESEDEKVRKWIIENIQETLDVDGFFEGHKTMAKNAIAWLEKQGEQKPAENKGMNLVEEEMTPFQKKVFCIIDTTIEEEQGLKQVCDELLTLASDEIKQKPTTEIKSAEESLGIDSDTYNKIVDECIYGEQKPAETEKGAKGNDREIPFSGQEWSEEDDKMFNSALWHVKNSCGNGGKNSGEFEVYYWLKSLKDRVQLQQKQEWSEEDYNEIETIACHLDNTDNEGLAEVLRNIRNKYYHIIPQSTWKPSDEQIKALERECMAHSNYDLCRLCEQLKKLREE